MILIFLGIIIGILLVIIFFILCLMIIIDKSHDQIMEGFRIKHKPKKSTKKAEIIQAKSQLEFAREQRIKANAKQGKDTPLDELV